MKNWKIRTKLLVAFSLMMIIFAAGGAGSALNVYKASVRSANAFNSVVTPMKDLEKLEIAFSNVRQTSRGFVIRVTAEPAQLASQTERLQGLLKKMYDATENYINVMTSAGTKDTIITLTRDVQKIYKDEFYPLVEKIIDCAKDQNFKEIVDALDATNKSSNKIFEKIEAIYALTIQEMENAIVDNEVNALLEMKFTLVFVFVSLVISIALAVMLSRSISKPLDGVVRLLKVAKTGDLRARSGINQKDELGNIAKFLDNFFEELQRIFKNLRVNSDTLFDTSKELVEISATVSKGTEGAASKSDEVANRIEETVTNIDAIANGASQASANAGDVASTAEEMSANMNTIASAMEEMSASINQIQANTSDAHTIAKEATSKATRATEVMNKLGNAATEIGQVTNVIKQIADKTNLLALNATIEAASAGESGKGFAVVAAEIKELANQSAVSADDIAGRIGNIQSETNAAVEVISDVSKIIVTINDTVQNIAGYVEQQTKASNEIANNVAQANTGTKRVSSAISEVARDTNNVNNNINDVAKAVSIVKDNATEASVGAKEGAKGVLIVDEKASALEKISEELKENISRFKI